MDNIGSGHTACAESSRWLCTRKGLWVLPRPHQQPWPVSGSAHSAAASPAFPMDEHMPVQRIQTTLSPGAGREQCPLCSPGTATPAEATISCHQQRCRMEHRAPFCLLTAICPSHNRRPDLKPPAYLLFFPPGPTETVCPPQPKQEPQVVTREEWVT